MTTSASPRSPSDSDAPRRAAMGHPRDPWRRAPVGELQEQLLPRWFVLAALLSIPLALGAVAAAFVVFGPRDVPVAARRPPPSAVLTNAVGGFRTGDSEPVVWEDACPLLEGIRIAGTAYDRALLATGLGALCDSVVQPDTAVLVQRFARAGGVVRFAQFEATGVDSTAERAPPRILVNAKFAAANPAAVAPLVVHDATMLGGDPTRARTALAARRAEARICAQVFDEVRPSRGCGDAQALLSLPRPLEALRDAGYR